MATERVDQDWLDRLEANRRQLTVLANAFEEEAGLNRPIAESVGDVITRDYEDADFAAALSDRTLSDSILHLLAENREQVEHALDRLADGKYGVCEDCGERIAAERLEFRPEATRCVDCQGRNDRMRRSA
jgi:DnaK suppressor protein